MSALTHIRVAALVLLLTACEGTVVVPSSGEVDEAAAPRPTENGPATAPTSGDAVLGAEDARRYLGYLAPAIVGRVLSDDERALLDDRGGDAVEDIVLGWTAEEGFVVWARSLIELRLSTSGRDGDVDWDLPGNLVEHVVRHGRPWSEILTSDTCYSAADEPIECDTSAPYTAGVLTTRGFMASNFGRFNLTRSRALLGAFACRDYPQADALQPRIVKSRLRALFRAETMEEQEVASAAGGFGNGFACYGCHGQFAFHAQLFVRYDEVGMWRADATGAQDPDGQLGEAAGGLAASHLEDPTEAASESSDLFGEPVANLADAAAVMAAHPVFYECTVENLLDHALHLDRANPIDQNLLASVAADAFARAEQPTLGDVLVATLVHPEVMRTVVDQLTPTSTEEMP